MRYAAELALCAVLGAGAGAAAADDDRDQKALQLRRVLRSTGVDVSPAVDRRLDALSDREISDLIAAHDALGYEETPLMVIGASVLLLALVVVLVVAVVK